MNKFLLALLTLLLVGAVGCSSGEKVSAEGHDDSEYEESEDYEEEESEESESKKEGEKKDGDDSKKEEHESKSKEEKIAKLVKESKAHGGSCTKVHWEHKEGKGGPKSWEKLCTGYKACGGTAQSPIDIVTNDTSEPKEGMKALKVKFGKTKTDVINNGHTVQFNVKGSHSTKIGKKKYKLLQFHYHAGSEHTVDGKQYPLEVHFVHKHSDKDFAVIGVMFRPGRSNPLLSRYLMKFPEKKGTFTSEAEYDLSKLLPKKMDYYHYKGSLTTPPCSEVVSWYVLKEAVDASPAQLATFGKLLDGNFRPVMPLNDREVYSFGG